MNNTWRPASRIRWIYNSPIELKYVTSLLMPARGRLVKSFQTMESVITQFNFTIRKRGDFAALETDSCIRSGRIVLILSHDALHLQTHSSKRTHLQLTVNS